MPNRNKNTDILVSIVMPCYNAFNYLEKAISSLAKQKSNIIQNQQLELIIVDDASDDKKTINKCRELASQLNFIKLIELKENLGQGFARNEGVMAAHGKYIGFMDADDEVSDNYFEIIEENLKAHSNSDVYVWGLTELHYDSKNNLIKEVDVLPENIQTDEVPNCVLELEKKTLFGYLWNKLYKTEIIKQNKISFENKHLIEDYLYNLDYIKYAKSVCCINESLYKYYRRLNAKSSVTATFDKDYFSQHYERVKSMYDYLKNNNKLNNEAKSILGNIYVRYSLSAVWRNKNPMSKMNKTEQNKWLENYFNLPLSKELLKYVNPKGFLAKINASFFKGHHNKLIMLVAALVNITNKHMDKTLIKARQSR